MNNIIRFRDLSYEQKLKLIDEEVNNYIKIVCSYEGVKLLPMPVEPIKPEMEAKVDFFRIAYNSDLTFVNAEDADKVLKLLRTFDVIETCYTGEYGSHSYVKKIHKYEGSINTESYYTKEQYEKVKEELIKYDREKTSYDALEKEYSKSNKLLVNIQDDIWGQMREIRELDDLRRNTIDTYLQYLGMAKGDNGIAVNFLTKAYSHDLAQLKKGLGKKKYDTFVTELGKIVLKK